MLAQGSKPKHNSFYRQPRDLYIFVPQAKSNHSHNKIMKYMHNYFLNHGIGYNIL